MAQGTPIARLADRSSHGGTIITACQKTYAGGRRIARKGDLHACPISGHGVTPIVGNVSPLIITEGRNTAKVGSVAGCGAVIVTGDVKTIIV